MKSINSRSVPSYPSSISISVANSLVSMKAQVDSQATNALKRCLETAQLEDATLSETDSSDADSVCSKEETEIAQALAKAAFSQSKSSPALDQLIKTAFSEQQQEQQAAKKLKTAHITSASLMRYTESEPNLRTNFTNDKSPVAHCKPDDFLSQILGASPVYVPYDSLDNFFVKLSHDNISSYDMELVKAVRDQNVDQLKQFHASGRQLHAGNRFGETILHAACRRGSLEVVEYLLSIGVPINVCCDYGRTPLHDAAWTTDTNWKLVDVLLDHCPDCLYITDRRGFTPLSYAPAESHAGWCRYLEERGKERLQKRTLA